MLIILVFRLIFFDSLANAMCFENIASVSIKRPMQANLLVHKLTVEWGAQMEMFLSYLVVALFFLGVTTRMC